MGNYRKFTGAEKSEIWDRIIAGETPASIAWSMGRYPSAVRSLQLQTGGVRPYLRSRGRRALSMSDREEISRGVAAGLSVRAIAAGLGRAASTVSREITRNGDGAGTGR